MRSRIAESFFEGAGADMSKTSPMDSHQVGAANDADNFPAPDNGQTLDAAAFHQMDDVSQLGILVYGHRHLRVITSRTLLP